MTWELSRTVLEELAQVAEADDQPDVFHRWLSGEDTQSGNRELACRNVEPGTEITLCSMATARRFEMKACPRCFEEAPK